MGAPEVAEAVKAAVKAERASKAAATADDAYATKVYALSRDDLRVFAKERGCVYTGKATKPMLYAMLGLNAE